jgi:serine/threonine-protein kinase
MDLRSLDYRRIAKLSGLFLGIFLVLFLAVDDVVMPLYVQQDKTTKVPVVIGLNVEEAKTVLLSAGLTPHEGGTRIDKQYPIGTVAVQNPVPGSEVKFDRGVYLTISGGEPLVIVPALRGKSLRDAIFTLERTALSIGNVTYEISEEFPENTIISQDRAEGLQVRNGTKIGVTVSQGTNTNKLPIPNVTLKSLEEAQKTLTLKGFKIGTISYQINQDLLPNTVIEQYPKAGELLSLDQPINLFVSQKGEKKSTTEN